jgi:hypothetical protein
MRGGRGLERKDEMDIERRVGRKSEWYEMKRK